jgi:hypothetical protein
LPLVDGRYLVRAGAAGEEESVLVLATLGAPAAPPRRRRRSRPAVTEPSPLPLTRATAIRAYAPFEDPATAGSWLDQATEVEETADTLIGEGLALLNRALHIQAVAATDPRIQALHAEHAVAVRVGYGSGEEVADGRSSDARELDLNSGGSRRQRREADLRPQERVAAVLGGREQIDACETLLLRARADLDAGRQREAALQLRVGLEALLVELRGTSGDAGHEKDMAGLGERKGQAVTASEAALGGELSAAQAHEVSELLEVCERVLRRRRVLRG